MQEEILKCLEGLDKGYFDVRVLHDAWYSPKALTRALGADHSKLPNVSVVRVGLNSGMLELHPKDDKVHIRCYCCFGGNPDHGLHELSQLKEAVESLKDHYCPPWPG